MLNYGMYPSYQPMLNAQQRIQQYEQMMPQMQQPMQQQFTQNIPAILVSTVEEAKAYISDSFGNPTLFYNVGKNEIYLKRTNRETAEAEFFTFAKLEQPLSKVKEEKNINAYENNFKALNDKIDGIYSLLQEKQQDIDQPVNKGGKNVK